MDALHAAGRLERHPTVETRDWAPYRSIFTDEVEFDFSSFDGNPARCMQADDWVAGVQTAAGWKLCAVKLTVTWSRGNRHVMALALQRRTKDAARSS